jgi:murein DD-endopeptidase MepM/ murein hydrolase activator NlpD
MKILHQPVRPWIVGQKFGANEACVDLATGKKTIACDGLNPPPGYKSLYGSTGHKGIDVRAYHGQPVHCALDGIVSHIDTNPRTGLDVRIESEQGGKRYRHIYEHLLGYQHKVGDKVEAGEVIGWTDNTGYSAGDHLHFQLEEWTGKWTPIDPEPLLSNMFAGDALLMSNKIKYIKEQLAIFSENLAEYLRKR